MPAVSAARLADALQAVGVDADHRGRERSYRFRNRYRHGVGAADQELGVGAVIIELAHERLGGISAGWMDAVIEGIALALYAGGRNGLLPVLARDRALRRVDIGHGLRADDRGAGAVDGDHVAGEPGRIELPTPSDRQRDAVVERDQRLVRAVDLRGEDAAADGKLAGRRLDLHARLVLGQLAADKSKRALGEARYQRAGAGRGVVDELVDDEARAGADIEGRTVDQQHLHLAGT